MEAGLPRRPLPRRAALLAAMAAFQLAMPATATPSLVMAPSCGGAAGGTGRAGAPIPLRIPRRDDSGCCKICHIAMRKRGSGDNCCGHDGEPDEDDGDVG